ncbi:glycosyltransferase family 2 protein [Aliiruegeria haliotis]|nr:glycosyltransferase family 2 protein [Aliiruegeria haliotis]
MKRTPTDRPHRVFHLLTSIRNEGPYIVEWIAHHRALGVERFTFFHNDCDDGADQILRRLQELGVIEAFDNPVREDQNPQFVAARRAGELQSINSSDWVAFLDVDEFLDVRCGTRTLDALIDAVGEDTDAISFNWRFMGSGGQVTFEDNPVMERFVTGNRIGELDHRRYRGIKTLFRPQKFGRISLHRPMLKSADTPGECGLRWVNGSGNPMGVEIFQSGYQTGADALGYDLAYLNHYAVRSREEYLLKRMRGSARPSHRRSRFGFRYWDDCDFNTSVEPRIPTEGMLRERAALLADAELARLHHNCVEISRAKLATLRDTPEAAKFLAGKLPGVPPRILRRIGRIYRKFTGPDSAAADKAPKA